MTEHRMITAGNHMTGLDGSRGLTDSGRGLVDALLSVIDEHDALWKNLRKKTVAVTTRRGRPVAFHLVNTRREQAGHLAEAGVTPRELKSLCASLKTCTPRFPCVIDIQQAAALVREQKLEAHQAVRRSKVRYQGTDGVRGKIGPDREDVPPLAAFVEDGCFTPALCDLLASAFAACGEHGLEAIVAEDGRDAFGKRNFTNALIRGLTRFGCKVLDLGIAPTPFVPVIAAERKAPLAVVGTASHNPADQNGVKFFRNGRKPLPVPSDVEGLVPSEVEGPVPDDEQISAHAFLLQAEGLPEPSRESTVERGDAMPAAKAFFQSALETEDLKALKGVYLVVDVAHGAFAPYARKILDSLGLDAEVINADMTGDNVNRDSGVAYIEGRDRVGVEDIDEDIEFVQRVWEKGGDGKQTVMGIALDADGDRAMLALCDPSKEEVRIIDGDRMAFLIAKLAAQDGRAEGRVFAGTVESDLAVFDAVRKEGIETEMTPVGDKWLSSRPKFTERLLVGEESSGHLVWPVEVAGKSVVTGTGLLSGLHAAAAVRRLDMSLVEASDPFTPGVVRTFYTYFVDRSRFYRGSPVWTEDVNIARETLARLVEAGELPAGVALQEVKFKEDEDMLYLRLEQSGQTLGALFARNSGTENKTATYARGLAQFEKPLVTLARTVNANHIARMKDACLVETRAEQALMKVIAKQKSISMHEVHSILKREGIDTEAGVSSILFALGKEGLARRSRHRLLNVRTD